jgi:O-antigen ligase
MIVAALSLALNAPAPKPFGHSMKRFEWVAHLYLLIWAFSFVKLDLHKWFRYFCAAFLLPNIYALWAYWHGFEPISKTYDSDRVVGLVHSATYHAHANAVIFVFFGTLFVLLFNKLSSKDRMIGLFCFSLMFASIFLTLTRGIWFSVAVSMLFLLGMMSWRYLTWGAVVMTGLFGLCFRFSTVFHGRIQDLLIGATQATSGVSIRANLMRANFLMIHDHPFFGIGYWDQYRQIKMYWPRLGLPSDYFMSHAHDQFVNVFATTGAFGLFFYLAFIGYFLYENVRLYVKAPANEVKVLLLACLVAQIEFHLACLTDVTFEYAKIRVLIVLVWALLIMIRKRYFSGNAAVTSSI